MDWLDLLAAQGTLKRVFQHHSSKASMQDTWVQSLGREDLLEKGLVTHSSILKFHGQWMEEPGWLQSMGSQRVGHNWATHTHNCVYNINFQMVCGPSASALITGPVFCSPVPAHWGRKLQRDSESSQTGSKIQIPNIDITWGPQNTCRVKTVSNK